MLIEYLWDQILFLKERSQLHVMFSFINKYLIKNAYDSYIYMSR